MRSIHCRLAESRQEIDDALRVRWEVLGEELDLLAAPPPAPREVDAFDTLETTLHFLAYADGRPVGTARLLLPNPEVARLGGVPWGLDLESKFDLQELRGTDVSIAEATRFCVLSPFRSTHAVDELALAMRRESQARGITHWIAAANTETDSEQDARIVSRVAARLGLVSQQFQVVALRESAPPSSPRAPLYTPEERARAGADDLATLRLPRPLLVFARRLGARFTGAPRYDVRFRRYAVPLIAAVDRRAHVASQAARSAAPAVSIAAESIHGSTLAA